MLNLEGRIGGDAELSHRGEEYARKLPQLVRASVGVSFFFLSLSFFCVLRIPSAKAYNHSTIIERPCSGSFRRANPPSPTLLESPVPKKDSTATNL